MNFAGLIVGACTFLSIGMCHPFVIKMEYKFGKQGWWIFLVIGLILTVISLCMPTLIWATVFGAMAFSCFWGILEMFQQETRVLKGWFPENPKRHAYYEARRKALGMKSLD